MYYVHTLPDDSIRLAIETDSPMRQYLGILTPTTPATMGPVWIPVRTRVNHVMTMTLFIYI